MNWSFILGCLWEGFAALAITLATGVMAMQKYPSDPWQFVVLGAGGLIAFVKAVDAYRRTPH
jgi:hypothetical protein